MLPGDKEEEKEAVDEFGPSAFARLRKFVWELFEEPNKSKLGKVEDESLVQIIKNNKGMIIKTALFDPDKTYTIRDGLGVDLQASGWSNIIFLYAHWLKNTPWSSLLTMHYDIVFLRIKFNNGIWYSNSVLLEQNLSYKTC